MKAQLSRAGTSQLQQPGQSRSPNVCKHTRKQFLGWCGESGLLLSAWFVPFLFLFAVHPLLNTHLLVRAYRY